MPIRSLIEFVVKPGAEQAFEAAYLQNGFLDRAHGRPGFLRGEFLRIEGTTTFWATALWLTEADYKAWQKAYYDVFSADELQAVGQHLSAVPQGFATKIVHSVATD